MVSRDQSRHRTVEHLSCREGPEAFPGTAGEREQDACLKRMAMF